MVLMQFKLNALFLNEFFVSREIIAVLLTGSKRLNVCMHSDIYEAIWVKFGMIIGTIKLSILILV